MKLEWDGIRKAFVKKNVERVTCSKCKGKKQPDLLSPSRLRRPCSNCGGTGWVYKDLV